MNKFEHRPMSELVSLVRNDFRKFDQEGLIDEGTLIKTVMYCNEKLGIPLRDIREVAIDISEYQGELPLDFDKLYYIAALDCSNSGVRNMVNPFDNNVDQDVIYKCHLDRGSLGCTDNYNVVIERKSKQIIYNYNTWTQLHVSKNSHIHCHIDCPNKRRTGKYEVEIKDGKLITPFRTGTIYILYLGQMKDEEGNVLFPFHPLITPYYEWSLKEKVISDAIFNSDGSNLGEMYQLAQREKTKAWLDAFNFTIDDRSFGQYKDSNRKRELGWYNQWFKYFK